MSVPAGRGEPAGRAAGAAKWLLANCAPCVYQAPRAAKAVRPKQGAVRAYLYQDALKDIMATVEHSEAPAPGSDDGIRRRDFINIAAVSFAGVGAAALLYPLVNQMNPSADVLALASIDVDISRIEPGQAIKTIWRKQPIFIRNLTPPEIQAANAVDVGALRDPQTLAERTVGGRLNWLITLGVCTHLGCVPLGAAEGENKGEYGGYFCPCHGSHYDTAGRIRKGPAPTNLEVPTYEFISDTAVRIG
jgi:ubiquinol-cytochrome c reductase iron-sulfur subunit